MTGKHTRLTSENHAQILARIAQQVADDYRLSASAPTERFPGDTSPEGLRSRDTARAPYPDDGYQGLIGTLPEATSLRSVDGVNAPIQPMTVPGDYVLPERFREGGKR